MVKIVTLAAAGNDPQSRPLDLAGAEPLTCKEFPFRGRQVITSRLTSKAQTTIPQPVRAALRLEPGDELLYAIEGDRVVLTKAAVKSADDPVATFTEWAGEADSQAYADL